MLLYNKQQSRDLIHDQGTETLLKNKKLHKVYAIYTSLSFHLNSDKSFKSIAVPRETRIETPG